IWSIARKGNLSELKLLADSGFYLDVKCNEYGSTPLMYASQTNELECVKLLIERGANVNATNGIGRTPLFFAQQSNYFDVATFLIQNGAKIDDLNVLFRSALIHSHEALSLELI